MPFGWQGVRSIGIMDHILSSGSGRGRVAFYDLRVNDYISVQPEALSRPQSPSAQHSASHTLSDTCPEDGDSDSSVNTDAETEDEGWRLSAFQPSAASIVHSMHMHRTPDLALGASRHSCFLQTGAGWLDHNHVYR